MSFRVNVQFLLICFDCIALIIYSKRVSVIKTEILDFPWKEANHFQSKYISSKFSKTLCKRMLGK